MLCATSKGSDQPAHMHRLIGAFASDMNILFMCVKLMTEHHLKFQSLKGGCTGLQICFCIDMRDFMLSLSDNNQTGIIEAFNSTLRYLDGLLNIDTHYFEQMVGQIYPTELQLNKANSSDTEAPFLDLNLSITYGIVSSKIYDKRDDFNFEIVNFSFLGGDVPRSPSCGVYISQLIRFARVCSNVDDFNNRNLFLTTKILKQGYRYHKIQKAFSKFYHRHSELIVKYNIGLKTSATRDIRTYILW